MAMPKVKDSILKANRVVQAVLKALNNRRGFDDWWGNLDDDIRREIERKLIAAIEPHVRRGR